MLSETKLRNQEIEIGARNRGDQAELPRLIKFATRTPFNLRTMCLCKFPNNARSRFQKLYGRGIPCRRQNAKRRNAPAFLFFSTRQNAVMARNMSGQHRGSPFSEIIFPQTSSEQPFLLASGFYFSRRETIRSFAITMNQYFIYAYYKLIMVIENSWT